MIVTHFIATGGEFEVPTTSTPKIVWEEGKTVPFTINENKVSLDHTLQEGAEILILETNT